MNPLLSFDWASLGLKLLAAIVVLVITAILAAVAKGGVARLARRIPALQRQGADGQGLGNALGTIVSMVIWLFGLMIVLGIFQLSGVLAPVTDMLGQALGIIPNIVGAVFVFVIGLTIAKIVKALIVTALNAVDFGKLLGTAQAGVNKATGGITGAPASAPAGQQAPPQGGAVPQGQPAQQGGKKGLDVPDTLGSVVFALIMIVVSIAALQILGIASISDPASQMLTSAFLAIPNIIAAVALVAIGVLIARFVTGLFRPILDGSGIDAWLQKVEILPAGKSATPVVVRVIEIAVVLFFAVMAAQVLGFSQITTLLSEILSLGGSVLFGGAIIAAGFFIATIVGKLLSGTVSAIVRWAIIILFAAMGLQSMGVADSIIQMAFGALVIGAAAAAVLAFGLGGREAAARQLRKLEENPPSVDGPRHAAESAPQQGAADPAAGTPWAHPDEQQS